MEDLPPSRTSLARRLTLVLAIMLLPVVAVAAAGLATFRSSIDALDEFRRKTVDESKRIDEVRDLLVEADDLGESYAEERDPAVGKRFETLRQRIEHGFGDLATLATQEERDLAAAAHGVWSKAVADLRNATSVADPSGIDARLDPFHDHLDEAGSVLADLNSLNGNQVADEISSLRRRERDQLFAALAALLVGSAVAGLLARKVSRSITTPLLKLEEAAVRFGSDDLSHRIPVSGEKELARVGGAFNTMASRLEQSRADLQESERRFRALVQKSSDITLVLDGQLRIRYVAPSVEAILGYDPEALLEQSIVDLLHVDDLQSFLRDDRGAWKLAAASGTAECRWRHSDGSWRDLELVYTDRADDPTVSGVVVNARDITVRKRLQADLRQSQRLESVGQLAAGVAHEINTPIQFVGDNLRFVQNAVSPLEQVRAASGALADEVARGSATPADAEAVRTLARDLDIDYLVSEIPNAVQQSLGGIERVATIVRAMKAFGHPGNDQKGPADLNEALQNTLIVAANEYRHVADVETSFGELPLVTCHQGELSQVFLNLLLNAAHAIADVPDKPGGRGLIRVETRRDADAAVISISDTGTGIPPEIRERIFEPFFTTKEVGRGTGQGLSLAYATVVERHGGTITVDSEVGRGSTFSIRIPFGPVPTAPVEAMSTADRPAG
jgi:PAS domain S-box-containing protein